MQAALPQPAWCPYRPHKMTPTGNPSHPILPAHRVGDIAVAAAPIAVIDSCTLHTLTCRIENHTVERAYVLTTHAPVVCDVQTICEYLATRAPPPLIPRCIVHVPVAPDRKQTRGRPLHNLVRILWHPRWVPAAHLHRRSQEPEGTAPTADLPCVVCGPRPMCQHAAVRCV